MKDRIPTQILPNGAIRYAIYDASGNFLRYDYILAADEPSEDGTALNKANLFRDTTALALGLPTTAVPDDAFNILSSAALIRRTPLTVKRGDVLKNYATESIIQIAENGVLRDYIVAEHNYQPDLNGYGKTALVKKETPMSGGFGAGAQPYGGGVQDTWMLNTFFPTLERRIQDAIVPANIYVSTTPAAGSALTTITRAVFPLSAYEVGLSTTPPSNNEGNILDAAAMLRAPVKQEAGSTLGINWWTRSLTGANNHAWYINGAGVAVTSVVGNAQYYRPAFLLPEDFDFTYYEDSDGNRFDSPQYANAAETVLGENIGGFTNMEMLEYVGTGASGATNPNTISFNFRPDLVIVQRVGGVQGGIPWVRPSTQVASDATSQYAATMTWGDNGISWYSPNFNQQLNMSGQRYTVIAFGR